MTQLLITHGRLFTLGENNRYIPDGAVAVEDGKIAEIGTASKLVSKYPKAKRIDARDKLILPGFICAHHHFYSALARGMSVPGKPPRNFLEILKKLWWKLDAALDAKTVYYSSLVSAVDCLKHGVTTVIDHHESQNFQLGSLDEIERAVHETGLRANLCLGVSDRYGRSKEGIKENARFLQKLNSSHIPHPASLVSASVGLHASFTVKDSTVEDCVALARRYQAGVHTHCAEDISDQRDAMKKHRKTVVERLYKLGALGRKSILVHCVHTKDKELDIIRATGTSVVHNPESNMNNAVGASDILNMMRKGIRVGLGTDGMSSEMTAQARTAYLLQRHVHCDPRVAFAESANMLIQNNSRIVSALFNQRIGVLEPGAAADIITVDYNPPTPISENNFMGHLMFGLPYARVDTVIVDGKVRLKGGQCPGLNENEILSKSREHAKRLWSRIH